MYWSKLFIRCKVSIPRLTAFRQFYLYCKLCSINLYKEGNLTTHSTHFINGHMASDIW